MNPRLVPLALISSVAAGIVHAQATKKVDPAEYLSGPAFLSSDIARKQGFLADVLLESGLGLDPDDRVIAPQFTSRVTNDASQDVEPAIISQAFGGVTFTSVTYIKRRLETGPSGSLVRNRNYFATTSNLSSWSGGPLPIPAGFTQSGDPLMDMNFYAGGIAPNRLYCTGIVFQDNVVQNPSAIGIWSSDDAGQSWSQPTLVDVESDSRYFLDKPDVVVGQWSGARGVVYVAYTRFHLDNPEVSEILVARSADGGLTFAPPTFVASGLVNGPQLVTNSVNGNVGVIWIDFRLSEIRMAVASSASGSWSLPERVATGNFVGANTGAVLNGTVRAPTLPMVRYNWNKGVIGVVWHEFEFLGSTQADIYFAAKTTTGWQPKRRINAATGNDQFMPAIDFDNSGNFLVAYYDRSGDPGNRFYGESWVKISPLGLQIDTGAFGPATFDPQAFLNAFIGDYQELWFDQRFNLVWVQQGPISAGDLFVTGVQ